MYDTVTIYYAINETTGLLMKISYDHYIYIIIISFF